MPQIGVQTKNVIDDSRPQEGFALLKRAGFSCADFGLNGYHTEENRFFDRSLGELEAFFAPHKQAAREAGIVINQMHMPYPLCLPDGDRERNEYLQGVVAPKSMKLCAFFGCPYIVVHGFKLARYLGSEEREWEQTNRFLDVLAPMAKDMGITICMENLYNSIGGHLVEGPCCDAKTAAERIDRMNEKYHAQVLGFCFDTGHANLLGIDFETFIATLGNRLNVLHIHDNDGISDLHQIPFTFTRTRENRTSTDWQGLINGLRKIGFCGTLSFETAPVLNAFPEAMKEEVLCFIAKTGRYLSGEIVGQTTFGRSAE